MKSADKIFGKFCRKKFLILISLLLITNLSGAQDKDTKTLVSIGKNVLKKNSFSFIGIDDKKEYKTIRDIPDGVSVRFKNSYVEWSYSRGVLNIALIELGNYLKDDQYADYVMSGINFGLENYHYFEQYFIKDKKRFNKLPLHQIYNMSVLDDYGTMSASIIDACPKPFPEPYRAYIENVAKFIFEKQLRLPDKTFCRNDPQQMTVWADDLYMSVVFLARMGNLTEKTIFFDDALRQSFNFHKYLWDPSRELYYHCYFTDKGTNGVAHWGRSNGWIMMAFINLLCFLPENYPQRDSVVRLLEKQIVGISRYQNTRGLWCQLLDKNDSYEESSCTAMFVYSIAKAVNEGWIDKRYSSIAMKGWEGMKKHMITHNGQMKNICIGTGVEDDLFFYYSRPKKTDDMHGIGALILAGVEISKLKQNKTVKNPEGIY